MPLIVTDADVLAQIAIDDGLAAGVDAQFAKLAQTPPATLAAWKARLAAYQEWASQAKSALSGGFLFGAWFGVPALGNQAVAWGEELGAGSASTGPGWQTLVNQIASGATPTVVAPSAVPSEQVAAANATIPPLPGLDTSTKLLGFAALGVVALMLLRRK